MRRRTSGIILLLTTVTLLAGGCHTVPRGGYAYDPNPPLRLDLMLEGLGHVALFGLFLWAGHGHHHGGHFKYEGGFHGGSHGQYHGDYH